MELSRDLYRIFSGLTQDKWLPWLPGQFNEVRLLKKTWLGSFQKWKCIGCHIPSYLATITNNYEWCIRLPPPSEDLEVTSQSKEWYKRSQKTLLESSAPTWPFQGYCQNSIFRLLPPPSEKRQKASISTKRIPYRYRCFGRFSPTFRKKNSLTQNKFFFIVL